MRTTAILVPIGTRGDVRRVGQIVTDAARAYGVPTRIIHVVEHLGGYPAINAREWLEPAAEKLRAELMLVQHPSVSEGLRDVIVGDSDALVCMTVEATGGRMDALAGSIAEDLLMAGHHRFLLVGPKVPESHSVNDGPAVICVDGSEFSESILPHASEWATVTASDTWTVQVVSSPPPAAVEETNYIHSVTERLALPGGEWEVLHGKNPADSIIEFARSVGAGSVVMATHGRSGMQRIALGSVAIRVAHGAPCPVLVRRPTALVALATGAPSTIELPR